MKYVSDEVYFHVQSGPAGLGCISYTILLFLLKGTKRCNLAKCIDLAWLINQVNVVQMDHVH